MQNQIYREGASINRPPLFEGNNYPFWKSRMQIFLQTLDYGVWDAVENGPFIPMETVNNVQVPKHFLSWTPEENRRAHFDIRARNAIVSSITLNEFYRISRGKSAKEMWDILEVTHEGTEDVKRARKNTLIQEYEMFHMKM